MRAAVAAVAVLAGCSDLLGIHHLEPGGDAGGVVGADGGVAGNNAEPEFIAMVGPLLDQATCSASSCHTGLDTTSSNNFLGPHQGSQYYGTYYANILTHPGLYGSGDGTFDPNTAGLLVKGPHEGPAWNSTQAATVKHWLMDEMIDRSGSGSG